jgi:hypothetical protein
MVHPSFPILLGPLLIPVELQPNSYHPLHHLLRRAPHCLPSSPPLNGDHLNARVGVGVLERPSDQVKRRLWLVKWPLQESILYCRSLSLSPTIRSSSCHNSKVSSCVWSALTCF